MGVQKPEAEKGETHRLRKLRERLRRVDERLQDWDERLAYIHADKVGRFEFSWTFPQSAWSDFSAKVLSRIEHDASGTCALSREWWDRTAERRERCARLVKTRPPERDPGAPFGIGQFYGWPLKARPAGWRRDEPEAAGTDARGRAEAMHAADEARKAEVRRQLEERHRERKERSRLLLDEFRTELDAYEARRSNGA
ncbi:hypothetical protein [Lysobacter sp. M2-1]|uniref:hypothetical protein n=1 Tax=Lysobacter sp. M2-1 TaxID=2916839 RepID=UPI001F581DA7|nr:hypothetical protein [Lysobacter sp. M2-1]